MKRVAALGLCLFAATAFGCSGTDVPGMIHAARGYAWTAAGYQACIAAASLALAITRKSGYGFTLFIALLLSGHPAWTMSVASGDCGGGMEQMSTTFGVISLGALVVQAILLRRPAKA